MRPGKKTRQRGGDNSYWTSYSDMMAGMLFVFALILFAAVYQLVDLQQKKTVELQTKEAQLSTQQSLLIDQEAELKDKEELLAATTLALQQQQQELDENRTALTSAQESLSFGSFDHIIAYGCYLRKRCRKKHVHSRIFSPENQLGCIKK